MKRDATPWVVADSCPWPERRGLVAYQMLPETGDRNVYPFAGIGCDEVVVFIEDDPLTHRPDSEWTCVLGKADIWMASPYG
jgi:hypothetical protein